MNENFNELEKKLESAAQSVSLSTSEKNAGRATLQSSMRATAARSIPSPFMHSVALWLRPSLALLIVFAVTGGIASASEASLPGSPLYPVKVRVVEPVRAALAFTPEDKANFEIERAHRRLEEFAQVSSAPGAVEETTDSELATALQTHIEDATESIRDLATEGNETGALETAADLHALLEVHTTVLDRLDVAQNETAEEGNDLITVLHDSLDESEDLATSLEDALATASQEEFEDAIEEQADEFEEHSLAVAEEVAENAASLDVEDGKEVQEELAETSVIIESAKKAQLENRLSDAFTLYTDANDKLNRLSIIVEADSELGTDLIQEDESTD